MPVNGKKGCVQMEINKIFDLENDGVNMAVDGQFLYIRCKRVMHKYNLTDMSLATQNIIFKKDGKARGFAIYDNLIFLTDFCDLYILNKNDLQGSNIDKRWDKFGLEEAKAKLTNIVDGTGFERRIYSSNGIDIFTGVEVTDRNILPNYELLVIPPAYYAMFEINCNADIDRQFAEVDSWLDDNKNQYGQVKWEIEDLHMKHITADDGRILTPPKELEPLLKDAFQAFYKLLGHMRWFYMADEIWDGKSSLVFKAAGEQLTAITLGDGSFDIQIADVDFRIVNETALDNVFVTLKKHTLTTQKRSTVCRGCICITVMVD